MTTIKKKFCRLLRRHSTGNVSKLIEFLDTKDFFSLPASIRYHSKEEGDLCRHSLNVYNTYKFLLNKYAFNTLSRSKIIYDNCLRAALLHDICKVFYYKKINGKFKYIKHNKNIGHGKLSVHVLKKLDINITHLEEQLITFHMNYYNTYEFSDRGEYTLLELCTAQNNKLVKLLSFADDISAQFIEK